MPTAEQLAFSICTERRGVHVLLWDQQEDLVRALVGVLAAFDDMAVEPVLVSDTPDDRQALAALVETRISDLVFVLRPLSRLPGDPTRFDRIARFSPGDSIPFVDIREAYLRLSNLPANDIHLNHPRWELDLTTGRQDPMEDWLHPWSGRLGCNPAHPPSHLHFNAPPVDAELLGGGRSDPSSPELRLAVGALNPLMMILSIAAWVRRQ